ncbi:sialate O-acetylesterase-like isoform X2 [Haliotis rufescens]|uniref:sialate O-acetylesterase-like isoform X2 n=1 Tax=Haliotis rufescens TaxID=6454 RepID=UPI00201F2E7E|nr:sialate O-acetylesterase-like isoform X2 [Haliotis rufescens]
MSFLKTLFLVGFFILTSWPASGQYIERMSKHMGEITSSQAQQRAASTLPGLTKPFAFASYYSSHMVLQKAPKRATIWGYAANIGERIIIKVSERGTYTTKVYLDPLYNYGVWKLKLPAESSAGPFTITAISREKTITLTDVMFGDVWVCSGQSNMQFTITQGFNASEELADANNYPNVRLFTVGDVPASFPIPDLHGIWEQWAVADKSSVGGKPWQYFSAVCWLFGKTLNKKLGYPIGLIDTSWGGTPVEAWSSTDALAKCGLDKQTSEVKAFNEHQLGFDPITGIGGPSASSILWNGMVFPLLNMTIYGAIWYQGESNEVTNVHKYNCTFPAMIDDWRQKFHNASDGETDSVFPFGFVQLAAYRPDSADPGFPEIRWHQTADYGYVPNPRMKNVFMSVAMDLPDFTSPYGSIHPRDKQDVVARLAVSGMSVAYNQQGEVTQGPLPANVQEGKKNFTLMYTEKIKYNNLVGFEALCSVENSSKTFWTPTPILSALPTSITLYSLVCGEGQTVLGLRYSWRETPCAFKTCTVYSADNPLLPGPPFLVYRKMTGVAGTVHTIDWNTPTAIHN